MADAGGRDNDRIRGSRRSWDSSAAGEQDHDRIRGSVRPREGTAAGEQDHVRFRGGLRFREPRAAGEQDHGLRAREPRAAGEQDHGRGAREPPAAGEQAHGRSSRSLVPSQPRRLLHRPPLPRTSPYGTQTGARNRLDTGRQTKLYISNLGDKVTEDDIRILFSEVGELKACAIHCASNGKPRGTGEVVYFRHSDAMAALRKYHNVPLDGKRLKIDQVAVHFGSRPSVPTMPTPTPTRMPMPMPVPMQMQMPAQMQMQMQMPGLIVGQPRPLSMGLPYQFVPPQIGGYSRVEQGESSMVPGGVGGSADSTPQGQAPSAGDEDSSHQRQPTAAELDAELERYHVEARKRQD